MDDRRDLRWRVRTARLGMRELTAADAAGLVRVNDHPLVARFTGDGPLADEDAALDVIERIIRPQYRDHGVGRWAVVRIADDAFLGWCGLKYHRADNEYDLGYRLLAEHWGQGYATEAAAAVLAYGRARLPGARLVAWADVDNAASLRVLEKIGMIRERVVARGDGGEVVFVAPPA
jgi:ribosomal-protein-alanine N-acetyltransferase